MSKTGNDVVTQAEAQAFVDALLKADKSTLERLGVSLTKVAAGTVEMTLTVEDTMVNGHSVCHGGFLFALADTAFAYAIASVGAVPVTQQASFSFIRGVKLGDVVRCVATVSHAGRTSGFATAKLFVGERLVAEFQGSGMRLPRS